MLERTMENLNGWPSAAVFALGATVALFGALALAAAWLWWWERRL